MLRQKPGPEMPPYWYFYTLHNTSLLHTACAAGNDMLLCQGVSMHALIEDVNMCFDDNLCSCIPQ